MPLEASCLPCGHCSLSQGTSPSPTAGLQHFRFHTYPPPLQNTAGLIARYPLWLWTGGKGTFYFWVSVMCLFPSEGNPNRSMLSHGAMGNWTVLHTQDSRTLPLGGHPTTPQSDLLVSLPPPPSGSSPAEEQSACIPVLTTNTSVRAQGPLSSLALTLNFTHPRRATGCSHSEASFQKSQEGQVAKKS